MNAERELSSAPDAATSEVPPNVAAVQSAAERWLLRALPLTIFICLTSATLLFWWNDVESRQEDDWREFQHHTALVAGQITSRLEEHHRSHLRALQRLQLTWADLYADKETAFRREAATLCQIHPAFAAVCWVDTDYVMRWMEPNIPASSGPMDFKTMPDRWMEFRTALAESKPVVSSTHPLPNEERGALLILPLARGAQGRGFLVGALRISGFLGECLTDRASAQFHITLLDAGQAIYQHGGIVEGEFPHAPPVIERRVNIGDRIWAMRVQATTGCLVRVHPWSKSFLLWIGLSLSAIMAIMTWMLQARTKRLADQHDLLQESDARLRERVQSLRLLNELGSMLRQTLDLKVICSAMLAKLRETFGFDLLAFHRFDPQEQNLKLEAHHGMPPEMLAEAQIQTLGTRLAGRAAQTGELLVVQDLAADSRDSHTAATQTDIHFTVYMPVKHLDKVLGLLTLAYRSQRQLQPAELGLLTVITDAVGVAISNAQHFEQVRSSREFFQSLFDSATDAVFVETHDGRLTMANPRACHLLGYTADELIGRSSLDLFTPEDRRQVLPIIETRFKKDRETLFEANYQTKDGVQVPVEISTRRVRAGNQEMVITFSRDLTIRRRLEQELLQAQTMESIGTLAGGIAHDFNNQLSGILGFGSLTLSSMKPGDPHYGEILQMVSAAERAATLVQQLLTLGRKSPPKPRPINLNEVVDQVVNLLKHSLAETVEVRAENTVPLPAANVDPVQWEQVLMNLCLNARDAILQTRRHGIITIQTMAETMSPMPGRVGHAAPPGRYVTLIINDNGCGMDAVTRQRLFEPFFTTKRGGRNVGLGLAMVFNTVKSHQGYIEVESEPGVGSSFRIRLPAIEEPAQPVATASGESPCGEETILLVDDDLSVLDLTKAMLERSGYTVITARDAGEGLDIYKKNLARIALVITDLIMPKINGGEFIVQLREITPDLKIIVSTGYSADAAILTSTNQRPQAVIQKPFKMAELARLARQVLDGTAPPLNLAPPPN